MILGVAVSTTECRLKIGCELMSCGSLYGVIHWNAWDVDRPALLRLALDGSKGLAFLHGRSPPVVHRDVKSPNLLVSQDWAGKLSDFGLSQTTRTAERSSTRGAATVDVSPMWASPACGHARRGAGPGVRRSSRCARWSSSASR